MIDQEGEIAKKGRKGKRGKRVRIWGRYSVGSTKKVGNLQKGTLYECSIIMPVLTGNKSIKFCVNFYSTWYRTNFVLYVNSLQCYPHVKAFITRAPS